MCPEGEAYVNNFRDSLDRVPNEKFRCTDTRLKEKQVHFPTLVRVFINPLTDQVPLLLQPFLGYGLAGTQVLRK